MPAQSSPRMDSAVQLVLDRTHDAKYAAESVGLPAKAVQHIRKRVREERQRQEDDALAARALFMTQKKAKKARTASRAPATKEKLAFIQLPASSTPATRSTSSTKPSILGGGRRDGRWRSTRGCECRVGRSGRHGDLGAVRTAQGCRYRGRSRHRTPGRRCAGGDCSTARIEIF